MSQAPSPPASDSERVAGNRGAWEAASAKHLREYDQLLAQAREAAALTPVERRVLRPVLASGPRVVHLQSGHGLDDTALASGGARSVIGVDFSQVAARAAQQRAVELGAPCRYVVAQLPPVPLREGSADLVYTGKGALIWLPDIEGWAHEAARLLAPGGHLFVFEAHPAVPLWSLDRDERRIRTDRSYFARSRTNDTFPANGSTEWQWTLGEVVDAILATGLRLRHLGEHPEPFWQPDGVAAAVWNGTLPNTFSLLAQRPS